MSNAQKIKYEKLALKSNPKAFIGSKAYIAFLAERGFHVVQSTNYIGQGMNFVYHAAHEELKMRTAFGAEDYKLGGGTAFYGVGSLFNRMFGRSFGRKYGAPGLALNHAFNYTKSGAAGMISVQAAHALEKFVGDLKGNETFEKFIDEHYGHMDQVKQDAIVDLVGLILRNK